MPWLAKLSAHSCFTCFSHWFGLCTCRKVDGLVQYSSPRNLCLVTYFSLLSFVVSWGGISAEQFICRHQALAGCSTCRMQRRAVEATTVLLVDIWNPAFLFVVSVGGCWSQLAVRERERKKLGHRCITLFVKPNPLTLCCDCKTLRPVPVPMKNKYIFFFNNRFKWWMDSQFDFKQKLSTLLLRCYCQLAPPPSPPYTHF